MADPITMMVMLPDGSEVEALEVEVLESTERWSEFRLADGTIMRAKLGLITVLRIPGKFDEDGNPHYTTKAAPTVTVVTSAPDLREKKQ